MIHPDNGDAYLGNENTKKEAGKQSSSLEQAEVPGNFNKKQESDTSIGTGSADQGIDYSDLNKESEFGEVDNGVSKESHDGSTDPREKFGFDPLPPQKTGMTDQEKNINKRGEGHGLIQEGPGPDS